MITPRRLIITLATVTAALAALTPAAMASTPKADPYTCSSPGYKYTVAQDNIHIRASPNGKALYSIAKSDTFLSSDASGNVDILCVTNSKYNGTYWVLGFARANSSHLGWVGVSYMKFDASGSGY